MHPETKQQLYGGEITDYFSKANQYDLNKENKNIADVYEYYVKNKKSHLDLIRFNSCENFYDKLK
jgi:hypothetical protein